MACIGPTSQLSAYESADNPGEGEIFAPVQTGPGAHPASHKMGTGPFSGVKSLGRGFNFPPPSSAEVKYEGWNFNSGNYLFTTDTK